MATFELSFRVSSPGKFILFDLELPWIFWLNNFFQKIKEMGEVFIKKSFSFNNDIITFFQPDVTFLDLEWRSLDQITGGISDFHK